MKKTLCLVSIAVLIISVSGCATFGKRNNTELQVLKSKVSMLEAQIQEKDSEIVNLKQALEQETQAREKTNITAGNISHNKHQAKDIQAALKNAGYNPGNIDGKMGKQTRDAIKAFQKANNLKADGKVGKQTWELLEKYLTEKSK